MIKLLGLSRCLTVMVFLVTNTFTVFSAVAIQAADLQGGDKQKLLRVVLPENTKPMAYMQYNEARGIYIDVLEYIADNHGIELSIQLVSPGRAHQLMLSSSADLSVAYTIVETERPDAIYLPFSQKLMVSFYSLQDSEIEVHQESDLSRYRIGSARIIPELQYKGIKQQFFKASGHQVKALKTGRVDLILIADLGVLYWQKLYDARVKKVYPFRSNQISLWFNTATLGGDAEEYCQLFAKGFSDLRRLGKFKNITEKYNFHVEKKLFDTESNDPYSCVDSL
jgi:ABC-type amino acid transport substrate-binding protein